MKNLTTEEIMANIFKAGKVRMDRQLVMVRNIGRGANKVQKYHNFESGKDYDTLKEATEGKPITMIVKETSYGKRKPLTDDETIDVNGLYHTGTEKDLVVYDIVNINGEDYLSIAICVLKLTVPKDNEKRSLVVDYMYFVSKDKSLYKCDYSTAERKFFRTTEKRYVAYMNIDNMTNYNSLATYQDADIQAVTSRFGWNVVNFASNHRSAIDASYKLKEFLRYKEPAKKSGPKQRLIDELTVKPLEELEFALDSEIKKYAIISNVNECNVPTLCIRTFISLPDGGASEGGRIYVAGKNSIACKQNNNGEWVQMNLNATNSNYDYPIVASTNRINFVGTVLEYLSDVIAEAHALPMIAATLRYPYIETLYKNEQFHKIVVDAAVRSYEKINESIESCLGKINIKEKNFYKIIGANKNQINFMNDFVANLPESLKNTYNHPFLSSNGNSTVLNALKKIFNTTYINDIDLDTIKMVLDFLLKTSVFYKDARDRKVMFQYSDGTEGAIVTPYTMTHYEIKQALARIIELSGLSTLRALLKDDKLYNLYIYREETTSRRYDYHKGDFVDALTNAAIWSYYTDFLNMAVEIKKTTELLHEPIQYKISVNFSSIEDVKLLHDDIMPVHSHYRALKYAMDNEKKLAEETKKWENRKSSWKKWLYSDNEYTIVIPETPVALSAEGSALHHCVGGYIDRVANGHTNILFIRKTDDVDKPLFTVEMSNDSAIEQIHGSCNSRITDAAVVDKHPHIQQFVDSWIEKCGLRATNYNKVR